MNEIKIKLTIDGKEAVATLDLSDQKLQKFIDTSNKAKEGNNGLSNSFEKMKNQIIGLFAIEKITGLLGDSVEAFAEEERTVALLHHTVGAATEGLVEYAEKMAVITGIKHDEIMTAEKQIGDFVKDEDMIKKLTKATMDYSVAKGVNLATASNQVSRLLAGESKSLGRIKLDIDENAKGTERYNQIADAMTKIWGGQAEAAGNTFSGTLGKTKDMIDKLKESIGEKLAPIIGGVTTFIRAMIGSLLPLDDKIQKVTKVSAEQINTFDRLAYQYTTLALKINKTAEEKKILKDTITEMQKLYPNYLGNIDMEGGKFGDVSKAIEIARKKLVAYTEAQIYNAIAAKHMDELVETTEKLINAKIGLMDAERRAKEGIKVENEEGFKNLQQNKSANIILQNAVKLLQEKKDKQAELVNEMKKSAQDVLAPFTAVENPLGDDKAGKDKDALAKRLAKQFEDAQKEGIAVVKKYYEEVKFEDENYFSWKGGQYLLEAAEMMATGLEKEKAQKWLNEKLKALELDRQKWMLEHKGLKPVDVGEKPDIQKGIQAGIDKEKELHDDLMNSASQFGDEMTRALDRSGKSFISYLNIALQSTIRIMDIVSKMNSGDKSTGSGVLGIISSILPFFFMANGGIIGRAADGYIVPGNSYSGDRVPILANSGEMVLNDVQQRNLFRFMNTPQVNPSNYDSILRRLEIVMTGEVRVSQRGLDLYGAINKRDIILKKYYGKH